MNKVRAQDLQRRLETDRTSTVACGAKSCPMVETSLQDPLQQLSGEKARFVMISTSVIVFSTCSGCCVSMLGLEELDREGDASIVGEDDEDVDRIRHERDSAIADSRRKHFHSLC